jgi:hypothetical protein
MQGAVIWELPYSSGKTSKRPSEKVGGRHPLRPGWQFTLHGKIDKIGFLGWLSIKLEEELCESRWD